MPPGPHNSMDPPVGTPSALEGSACRSSQYMAMDSPTVPTTRSMQLRLRKHLSPSALSSSIANEEVRGRKTIARVKKARRGPEVRTFRRHFGRAVRAAVGVLLAGVIQTGSSTSKDGSTFLPSFYYLGGLAYAAIMVIYASAPTVGGVVEQIWQIDLGVGIALLYNFGVFSWKPITQGDLVSVPLNLNDSPYYVSLHDWGMVSPFMFAFTFGIFVLPVHHNVKKFAVMANAFFMLNFIDPMSPKAGETGLKDLSSSDYSMEGLMLNLAVYSAIGVVGTLITLITVLLPTPLFATKKLLRRMAQAPIDIRNILNLIVDSYCFRAKDIKKMDFFRLRLDRLLVVAQKRADEMEDLLDDCWWESMVGVTLCMRFNRNVATHFVKLYCQLLKDLRAMKFAIETENGHWTHVVLMKRMQQSIYLMQRDANELLQEIADNALEASTTMNSPKFAHLECTMNRFMKKYSKLYGAMLSAEVHTPDDVGKNMSLNVFVYSFHAFVHTLFKYEDRFKHKHFSCCYRLKRFFNMVWRSVYEGTVYMWKMVMFAVRTTLAVLLTYCASTFIFAFSATGPTAIAMVAQFHVGGTFGNMKNRMGGLVAGTVVPSILHFFTCKIADVVFYNAVNNSVLFVWIVGSMYVCFSSKHLRMAGMVSAYMSASVLLDHSCRAESKAISYSSLTENSVAIMILMLVEACVQPQSARGLLRSNIQQVLGAYGKMFNRIFVHHVVSTTGTPPKIGDLPTVNESDTASTSTVPGLTPLSEDEKKDMSKELLMRIPAFLKQQKNLVYDATAEPSLWKSKFSHDQYMKVLSVCWTLLDRLRLLSDLVEWRERVHNDGLHEGIRLQRRDAGRLNDECVAAFKEQKLEEAQHPATVYMTAIAPDTFDLPPNFPTEPPFPPLHPDEPPVVAKHKWDRSQNAFEAVIDESFDTLATLFSKDFTYRSADEYAIFLQMKEAFRIADKDHSGTVDRSELGVLLEKLMPYAGGQGNVRMENYVDEFMKLVDKNKDGLISFAEFVQALNDGFRLELEIYEGEAEFVPCCSDDKAKMPPKREPPGSMDISDDSSIDMLDGSNSASDRPAKISSWTFPPTTIFFTPPSSAELGRSDDFSPPTSDSNISSRRRHFWGEDRTNSNGVVLLNVESFSLNEAAATLKQSYGELLLRSLDDDSQYITMEDFIVMSCFISACEDIAANLTKLNTLAAS